MARLWHFLVALFLLCGTACADGTRADSGPPRFDAAALQADAALLQRIYESLHPGLYRYNTRPAMARHFAALRRELSRPRTLAEAYLAFSRFAATVMCGHTYANFYNQPEAVQHALFDAPRRLPFHFRWLDGRMIVTRDFSGVLAPGTEVRAIDGVPARTVLAKLLPFARADGHNDAKRIAWLSVQGDDTYEAFDIFLPLVFPRFATATAFDLRVRDAHGERRVTVQGVDQTQRLAAREPAQHTDAGPPWTLRFDGDLAILRMPTWALYEASWDWQAWLHETFEELARRGTPALAIDLRGNEGGLAVGDVLLAHLADHDVERPAFRQLVRYRRIPDEFAPYLRTWDRTFKDWGDRAVPAGDGWYTLAPKDASANSAVIAPRAPHYAGRTFVLVGANNSSATFEFANAVKRSGVARLVGQATGGNRRGINGSAFFFVHLPNTGIELDLPLVGQFAASPQPDAGVEPDLATQPTPEDIAAGTDVELAAVRRALGSAPL